MLNTSEKGLFIGKELDLVKATPKKSLFLDIQDLSTHGVIIGMTGSGKTGLGIVLVEEALINKIPVICIDVKGDLSNLGFGILTGQRAKNLISESIRKKSKLLTEWNLNNRLKLFNEHVKISIFTPGILKGHPVSLINSLKPPIQKIDLEELEMLAANLSRSLLQLIKPKSRDFELKSRALLTEILMYSWVNHIELTFDKIMRMAYDPPFEKIGGLDVESFISKRERRQLAFLMSRIFGSPNFKRWIHGSPLDIDFFLKSSSKKTTASIFYLAHLEYDEKMMFISLLLQKIYSWMLSKGASDKPRLLLFFDEIFGFLPPHPRNPPSKAPLLSIIKKGRAFGVTVIMSTQNPVDIDYKALGNVHLWIIGRLKTRNDRKKVLDGMSELSLQLSSINRSRFDKLISALESREFFICRANQPIKRFYSRESLSNLIGPFTLDEVIKLLRKPKKTDTVLVDVNNLLELPPLIFGDICQRFLPIKYEVKQILRIINTDKENIKNIIMYYEPILLLKAEVNIRRKSPPIQKRIDVVRVLRVGSSSDQINFFENTNLGIEPKELIKPLLNYHMSYDYKFKPVNRLLQDVEGYNKILREFIKHVVNSISIILYRCEETGQYSDVGEDRSAFRYRQRKILEERLRREIKMMYEKKLSQISSMIAKEMEKLEQLRSELEVIKSTLTLKGIIATLARSKIKSLFNIITREYDHFAKVKKQILLKENKLSLLIDQKIKLERQYIRRLNEASSKEVSISEIIIKPHTNEINITEKLLIWVPIVEVLKKSETHAKIKVNCFNGMLIES